MWDDAAKSSEQDNSWFLRLGVTLFATAAALILFTKLLNVLPDVRRGAEAVAGLLGTLLSPIVWGFAIAYLLFPIKRFFERRLSKFEPFADLPADADPEDADRRRRLRTSVAVAITAIAALAVIVVVLSMLFTTLAGSVQLVTADGFSAFVESLSQNGSALYESAIEFFAKFGVDSATLHEWGDDALTVLTKGVLGLGEDSSSTVSTATNLVSGVGSFFSNAFFAIIFAIYFLLDADGITDYWGRVLRVLMGTKAYQRLLAFLRRADVVFSGYIRGQAADAVFMAVMTSVALAIVDVPYAVVIGILAGVGNLIPYVGPIIGYGLTALSCLMAGDLGKMVVGLIVLVIIQAIDANVVNPRLLSQSIEVHPLLVIACLLVGGSASGLVGMVIAVPVGALIKLYFEEGIDTVERRRFGGMSAGGEVVVTRAGVDSGEKDDPEPTA